METIEDIACEPSKWMMILFISPTLVNRLQKDLFNI